MPASFRENHNRFRLEASNYGVVCYRGTREACEGMASRMALSRWGVRRSPKTGMIVDPGESFGTFKVYDRWTHQYV